MTIQQIIEMAYIRINYLNSKKSAIVAMGDIVQLNLVDIEIAQTQDTLTLLHGIVNNHN